MASSSQLGAVRFQGKLQASFSQPTQSSGCTQQLFLKSHGKQADSFGICWDAHAA
jgi:hypothetical protein